MIHDEVFSATFLCEQHLCGDNAHCVTDGTLFTTLTIETNWLINIAHSVDQLISIESINFHMLKSRGGAIDIPLHVCECDHLTPVRRSVLINFSTTFYSRRKVPLSCPIYPQKLTNGPTFLYARNNVMLQGDCQILRHFARVPNDGHTSKRTVAMGLNSGPNLRIFLRKHLVFLYQFQL